MDTDARDRQVGCLLLQKQKDCTDQPIGYWSLRLSKPEKNLDTTHQECLAVVCAVLLLRPYFEGAKFVIRTNHALRWILNLGDATGKLARWHLRLMEFHFEVIHRARVNHQAAESLSRLHTNGTDDRDIDSEIPVLAIHQLSRKEKHKLSCSC